MAEMDLETKKRRLATTPPRISIVIPSYNHEAYVGETINSILSQTFLDFELIIIDDGSSDGSPELIRHLVERSEDHNIVFRARENVGLCKTLNEGLSMSQGEFFSYVGSDDVWHPQKLESQIEVLSSAPHDYGACYCDCVLINERGERRGLLSDFYEFKNGDIYEDLVWNRFLPTSPTNFFRRPAVIEAGGFNEAHLVEDRDLWIRLTRKCNVAYIDRPLASWREHSSNNGKNVEKMYHYGLQVLENVIENDPEFRSKEPLLKASLDSSKAYAYFVLDARSEARRFAVKSIRNNPLSILPWRVLTASLVPKPALELLRTQKRWLRQRFSKAH